MYSWLLARERTVALVALTGFAALFFREFVAGGRLFLLDFHQTFVPLRRGLGAALTGGLPLWDGRLSNGTPLLANPLHAAWYPPNLLFAIADAPAVLTWLTLAHLLFGAWGAWLFARRIGLGLAGASVASLAFGFNGLNVSASAFANLCWSQAWLPWLLLAWLATVRGGRDIRPPLGVAIAVWMMLSLAEPFVLLAAAIGLIVLTFAELRDGEPPGVSSTRLRRMLIRPGLAALVGVLLASPFLVAVWRYLPHSVRGAGFVPDGVVYWSAHPGLALGLIAPRAFGDPRLEGLAAFWATGLVPDKGFALFAEFYCGVAVIGLALAAMWADPRRRWWLWSWGGVLLLAALGRYGPVYPLVAELPLVQSMRFPMKWLLPATLPLALLAGAGLDDLVDDRRAARRLWIVALALVLIGAGISIAAAPGVSGWIDRALARPDQRELLDAAARLTARSILLAAAWRLAVTAALLGALGVAARGAHAARRRWALPALVALVAVDLLLWNPAAAPSASPELYRTTPATVSVLRDAGRAQGRVWVEGPPWTDLTLAPEPSTAVERAQWQHAALMGYGGADHDLRLAFNSDVGQCRPSWYARLGSMVSQAPAREKLMLLGAAGVSDIVRFDPLDDPDAMMLGVVPGRASRPWQVIGNGLAQPRVRVVPRATPYADDHGFMRAVIDGPRTLFGETTLIDAAELQRAGLEPSPPATVHDDRGWWAIIAEDLGSRLTIRVGSSGGWLVLNDSWTPGWRAEIDGEPLPLVRADYAFRAVQVPPGEHEIVMAYDPWQIDLMSVSTRP